MKEASRGMGIGDSTLKQSQSSKCFNWMCAKMQLMPLYDDTCFLTQLFFKKADFKIPNLVIASVIIVLSLMKKGFGVLR